MGIRFDYDGCIRELKKYLALALIKQRDEFLAEAKSHMQTPEGANSLNIGELEELAGWLALEIVGGAWAAMDNYGTGSRMDTDNPFFSQYFQSELWHEFRQDTRIVSRAAGWYRNIFGEMQESKAPHPGYDLERAVQEEGKNIPLTLLYPSHALETTARWMVSEGRVAQPIRTVLEMFPWGLFLIPTAD